MPQGSCARQVLYLAHASTKEEIVSDDTDLHGYTDNHALKTAFDPSDDDCEAMVISRPEKCAKDIEVCMNMTHLKMNSAKIEFILFGSSRLFGKCGTTSLNINGEPVD